MRTTRRARRPDDRGFTLVELLLVMLVLGVLTAIAVFATRPFQERAEEACHETETTAGRVADAAERAGMGERADLLPDGALDCVDIRLVSVVAVENCCPEVTIEPPPATGHTVVAISGHRGSTGTATISGTGWVHRGTFNTGLGTSTSRGVAAWTKVWASGDDPTIGVDWSGDGSFSKSLVVQVFSRPLTRATIAANDSGASQVTSLSLGGASGTGGSALVIGGLVTRQTSGGAGPGTVTWSGVPGIAAGASQGSSINTSTGWATLSTGAGTHQAVATWDEARLATGFTMVMQR